MDKSGNVDLDKAFVEHYLLLIKVYRSIVADNDLYILFTMLSHLNIKNIIECKKLQFVVYGQFFLVYIKFGPIPGPPNVPMVLK